MTSVKNNKQKSIISDITGKSWADLCESSQSSQSQVDVDSPSKDDQTCSNDHKDDNDDLYDLVFKPVKKEAAVQDDLSLTSFMSNVHMVTPIKVEDDNKQSYGTTASSTVVIDEDTICSPFVKVESSQTQDEKPPQPLTVDDSKPKDIQHAKRRLTSECSTINESVTPERAKKVNKISTEHTNIHDSILSPKYAYFLYYDIVIDCISMTHSY